MLVENSDGTLEYTSPHLAVLPAEAEENERRGVFWNTCPYCKYTTNKIHEVYEHNLENCLKKNGWVCEICHELNPNILHFMWRGYECLEDGVQTMRAKLRPHRSTPYKPPKRVLFKEEEGKGKKASSSKELSSAAASSSGQ